MVFPVGTSAYPIHNNIQQRLFTELGIRVIIEEYEKDNLRVLVFNIPSRQKGMPVKSDGIAYMRNGSSIVKVDDITQAKIFRETELDFSGEICRGFSLSDIDEEAIFNF